MKHIMLQYKSTLLYVVAVVWSLGHHLLLRVSTTTCVSSNISLCIIYQRFNHFIQTNTSNMNFQKSMIIDC